ncbi:MAG: HEAT repeat domain-containing protein [Pirellulales bacterium]|nr:HEAT repeat domain-containing protein [Pirellulales bacterium]
MPCHNVGRCQIMRVWLPIFCGLGCLLATGCQSVNPFYTKPSATAEDLAKYGPTSAQRIKTLQEEYAKGPGTDAAEQAAKANELARQIQNERDPLVRSQILRNIALYPTRVSAAVLHAATNDPDQNVREVCCELWSQRGDEEAVQNLRDRAVNDESIDVRLAAVKGLGATKQSTAIEALAPILEEPDPALQYRAVQSLKQLSGLGYGDDVNKWREYVQTPAPQRPQPTLADSLGLRGWY